MITISPTRDSNLLAELNREVQDLHHRLQPEVFKPWEHESIAKALKEMLQSADLLAFVARYEEQKAGYILLRVMESPENAFAFADRLIYIDQISVKVEFRGKGIGKALVNRALEVAREEGITKVSLDHWTINEGARTFFGKAGFKYYNERMELQLE
jgi:ribosomal protein S18 acetylase RimI-like enzyme